MAGRKLFTNKTHGLITVTLKIRKGDDPKDQAGSKVFNLAPGESQWHEYGNDTDIYLNGINILAVSDGNIIGHQDFVVDRGSPLDDMLNRNNAVDFTFPDNPFLLSTRQA